MERMSTFNSGLVVAALVVVAAALGLVLLAPALDNVSLPAPREATEADVAQAWEGLVDAIDRRDEAEAVRLAEWLDARLAAGGKASPTTDGDVVRAWCDLGEHQWDFCEEATIDDDETPQRPAN